MTFRERFIQPKTCLLHDFSCGPAVSFVTKVGLEATYLFGVVVALIRLNLPNVRLRMFSEMTYIMTWVLERTDPPDWYYARSGAYIARLLRRPVSSGLQRAFFGLYL